MTSDTDLTPEERAELDHLLATRPIIVCAICHATTHEADDHTRFTLRAARRAARR
jgi:hypothetical protein